MTKYEVYDYSDSDNLPKIFNIIPVNPFSYMEDGISLLNLLNKRITTPRNIRDLNDILAFYFDVHSNNLKSKVIYIGETIKLIIEIKLFRIYVYADYD
jgi:hypothetical protein